MVRINRIGNDERNLSAVTFFRINVKTIVKYLTFLTMCATMEALKEVVC